MHFGQLIRSMNENGFFFSGSDIHVCYTADTQNMRRAFGWLTKWRYIEHKRTFDNNTTNCYAAFQPQQNGSLFPSKLSIEMAFWNSKESGLQTSAVKNQRIEYEFKQAIWIKNWTWLIEFIWKSVMNNEWASCVSLCLNESKNCNANITSTQKNE